MEKVSVLVVDFGSQYNQLIVRRVRDLNVSSKLIKVDEINKLIDADELAECEAIIFSGGPNVVTQENALMINQKIFDLDIPILGVCYGMQLISNHYGAKLRESQVKEYGAQSINIYDNTKLFNNLNNVEDVWMSHGWEVTELPNIIELVAKTKDDVVASIKIKDKEIYGVQFHPEVRDTENGIEIIDNFLTIANATRNYTMSTFTEIKVQEIKQKVGSDVVVCGLSGGVDSTVVATLLNHAIGKQLKCVLVDHGLLRKNEAELVVKSLKNLDLDITVIDAKETFLNELKGVTSPERKRKIIGKLFIDIFEEETRKIKNAKYLAQGTLYTDIIESGTDTAHVIKSHHNVGGLPENMKLKLIEPLDTLFKDEVRKLGISLGLSNELVYRQPFPGPGLAIRIMGEITQERIDVVKESDEIFREELKKYGLYDQIWQSFTVLTNTKTVGVKGDERSYEYVLALRAIASIDGMSAKAYPIPIDVLTSISTEITNNVKEVNRVVYDITNKPPSTIEWE